MHEITYSQVGDYLIPNLTIGDEIQQAVYGKYGMLRKQYSEGASERDICGTAAVC